ncbi:PREDICTED: sperm-tail PG-rich repeat-containing protein 2 [Dipodomys ordii]|uniref:Sperm-tail PG-rich repeat-containing protein 2 n=1 Tax=Dipodomys ordii TaxID=10020 RepID=A0A1S3G8N2_DIPOR|nr:PREDICTED: sperm-tail PG-rich repeat-containing protein 2 [Dipodomys ordii]
MYDRAPRLLRLAEGGSTEAHVGPGSYQVPFPKARDAGGYAPFLSWSARESSFTVASNTEKALPGPGHYNISKAQKSSRPPAVNRSLDIPSIPSYRQSHGYEINDDGIVKRLSAPYNDSTLGPAYYKPQFDAPRASLKYKGTHFGTSSRSRQFLPIQPGPGPGQYDIVQEKTLHYENVNVKKDHQESCASFLPRFFDLIPLQEKKRRFIPTKSVTPAPGAYNAIQTPVKCSKKAPVKHIPFGQGAARFKQICKKEELPGPGFYNILHNSIIDNIKNICSKKNSKCAFGSSTPRSFFQISKESPGPSHYQKAWNSSVSTTAEELPNLKNNYAIFLSRTKKKKYTLDMVLPAPGTYEVHKSYEMSQMKRKYMPPRSSIAEKKQSSFLSGTPRYQEKTTEGPGPGEYDPVLKKSCPIPLFVNVPKRFQDVKEESPGPTTYEEKCKQSLQRKAIYKSLLLTKDYFSGQEQRITVPIPHDAEKQPGLSTVLTINLFINLSQGAFQEERMMDRLWSHDHIHCHGEQKSGKREVAKDRVQWDTGASFPEKNKMNVPIVTAPCISLVISVTGL